MTILEAIEKISIYASGYQSAIDFYRANLQKDFNAAVNLLIAIGEESKKIDLSLKENEIPWDLIIGMRNRISHDYRGIDRDIIWNTINEHLPKLKVNCIQILKGIPDIKMGISSFLEEEYYRELRYLNNLL